MKTTSPLEVDHDHEASRDIAIPTQVMMSRSVVSVIDLVLRIIGAIGTLASAIAMGTTSETIPFISQFNIFITADYDNLPTFTFFVIANSVVGGYLVLSLPLSIFHVIKTAAKVSRIMLLVLDTIMLGLLTAGASAATAIVYLAHKGNASTNWSAVCQQLDSFCERISGSLIGSFGTVVTLMLIIITSAIAISRP